MIYNVPGVVVDGTVPATATPSRTDLLAYQGVDTFLVVAVTGSNGTAVNLTGYTATLTIRDRVMPNQGAPSVLQTYAATLTTPLSGIMTFAIPGAFLKSLILKTYWFDIFTTNVGGFRDEVVLTSMISIQQALGA